MIASVYIVHISQQSQISSKLFQIKHSPQELEEVLQLVGKVCTMFCDEICSLFRSSRSLHKQHNLPAELYCNLSLYKHTTCVVLFIFSSVASFVFQTYAKDLCQTIRIMLRRIFQQRPTMK